MLETSADNKVPYMLSRIFGVSSRHVRCVLTLAIGQHHVNVEDEKPRAEVL
jgi:hypothetical protein